MTLMCSLSSVANQLTLNIVDLKCLQSVPLLESEIKNENSTSHWIGLIFLFWYAICGNIFKYTEGNSCNFCFKSEHLFLHSSALSNMGFFYLGTCIFSVWVPFLMIGVPEKNNLIWSIKYFLQISELQLLDLGQFSGKLFG